jgi:trehalose 6-phosphate phosphatase
MVFELRAANADKGRAVEMLMSTPPFQGRVPLAVGDDHTDEPMFDVAQRLGGLGVRVGGDRARTSATSRLADPHAVRAWLRTLTAA